MANSGSVDERRAGVIYVLACGIHMPLVEERDLLVLSKLVVLRHERIRANLLCVLYADGRRDERSYNDPREYAVECDLVDPMG